MNVRKAGKFTQLARLKQVRKAAIIFVVFYLALSPMSHSQPFSSTSTRVRGRRRWPRGGHDGRGRGRGRGGYSAQYQGRSPPDSEQLDEDEVAELEANEARYARRTLETNADRYEEPEPEIGPDGMNSIDRCQYNMIQPHQQDNKSWNPR